MSLEPYGRASGFPTAPSPPSPTPLPPLLARRDLPAAGNVFLRLIAARMRASMRRERAEVIAAQQFPNDKLLAQMLTRAATTSAMTGVTGWAAELVRHGVLASLDALGPAFAGPQVLKAAGLVLAIGEDGIVSAPGFVAASSSASFVAEGAPIPVRQLAATAVSLPPYKVGVISVLSREMAESSNAEALIADTFGRAAGGAIDAALFDANAATAARPAGLRSGIAALTASSSTDLWEAAFEDVTALINSLAPVGGNGPYIIVTSPGRAASMALRFEPGAFTVLGSSAITNDVLAIAPAALVAALSPDPQVETSAAATLHMSDTPTAIVNGGAAAPARSLFQTDSIAIKVRWPLTWALRDVRGLAWLTPSWK